MVLDRERVFRRRRRTAFAALAIALLFLVWGLASLLGGGGDKAASAKAAELPRGGRVILPRERVVAFYGAPQHDELGVLGIGTPEQAGAKLLRQARDYARPGRPVLPAFELIASLAHAAPGQDGLHRERQSDAVIKRYLVAARRIKAILILDIQDHSMTFTPFSNGLSSGAISRRRLTPIVDWATVENTAKAL